MQPDLAMTRKATVHQHYLGLLHVGFTPQESTSLIAKADGIDRHAEGELPSANVWRWQEITGLEFLRYLARSGRVGG
jgi:hypothetical protein